jgi:uncharacterized protein YndB with AHSA1/START domain
MPIFSVTTIIDADPQDIFDAISELTRHPEWSTDPLRITPLSNGQPQIGSRYKSRAKAQGKDIVAVLTVTQFKAPKRFAFTVSDVTGEYLHEYSLRPEYDGFRVRHTVTARLNLPQTILFWLVYPFIKWPNRVEALNRLKVQLEHRVPSVQHSSVPL